MFTKIKSNIQRTLLIRKARKVLVRQQDQTDCGVACLASVISYYGGDASIGRLREYSGTNQRGTTLLGLRQAASAFGLKATAYRANLVEVTKLQSVAILHVMKKHGVYHYLICYGTFRGKFIMSDPAEGIQILSAEEMEDLWQTKTLITLQPDHSFAEKKHLILDKWIWLMSLIRNDINILGLSLALGIMISVLSLSTAVFSQQLIDVILPSQEREMLILGLTLLSILLLAKNFLSYLRQRFLITHRRDFNTRVIQYFFGSLLQLPYDFFIRRKTGDLIARMNDTGRLQSVIAYIIGDLMINVLLLIVATAFIFYYSISLGILALFSLPLFSWVAFKFHKQILSGQRNVMAAHSINESNYIDAIQGIPVIKTMNRERGFKDLISNYYRYYQDKIHELGFMGAGFNFWSEVIGMCLFIGLIFSSSIRVLEGTLQIGMMVAILQMGNILIPAAMSIALANLRVQEARVAFDRMYEFTSLEPEYSRSVDTANDTLYSIESVHVRNLSFRFTGNKRLLNDISFDVRRGEIIALLGESGSGKTTTLQILQRFYQPEQGEISINKEQDFYDISTFEWRNRIGVVPQQIKLFNGNLLDNICPGDLYVDARSILEFCEKNGFHRYFSEFPLGYMTLLGEDGARISGGQQQLVALARAIYRKPEILLLDEPTSEMDREIRKDMLRTLYSMKESMATILVTHQVSTAGHADRIYIIQDGDTWVSGSPAELAMGNNLFSRTLRDFSVKVAS